jgi:hypothetical protein
MPSYNDQKWRRTKFAKKVKYLLLLKKNSNDCTKKSTKVWKFAESGHPGRKLHCVSRRNAPNFRLAAENQNMKPVLRSLHLQQQH